MGSEKSMAKLKATSEINAAVHVLIWGWRPTGSNQKAAAHLYDAVSGDAPGSFYVVGFGKVAAYETPG